MSASKFKRLFKIRKQIANRPCLKQLSTNQPQPLLIRTDGSGLMTPYPTIPRNAPDLKSGLESEKNLTPYEAMQEFFDHPLTWERNNGYLNAIIGMLILTFWFTNNTEQEKAEAKGEAPQGLYYEEDENDEIDD